MKKIIKFFVFLVLFALLGVNSVSAALQYCYGGGLAGVKFCSPDEKICEDKVGRGKNCYTEGKEDAVTASQPTHQEIVDKIIAPGGVEEKLIKEQYSTPTPPPPTQTPSQNYQLLAPIPTVEKTSGSLLVSYMKGLFTAAVGLAIVLAVVMIVIGGIEYVAAALPSEKEGGKKRIQGAIGGLLLILASWVILNTLNPKLLNVGLNLEKVGVIEGDTTGASNNGGVVSSGGKGVGGKNLGEVYKNVSEKYSDKIATACEQQGKTIPNCQSVVAGVISKESRGAPIAESKAGASGIMQLLKENGGRNCRKDDTTCIQGQMNTGVAQLANEYKKFGNVPDMLAAYNGGGSTKDGSSPSGRRPAMAPSTDCPRKRAWQCDINPGGLTETKNYVTDICGVAGC